jgi:hypothetical protein
VLHDVPYHTRQRWLTCRRRWAAGDLFLGPYPVAISAEAIQREEERDALQPDASPQFRQAGDVAGCTASR